jgi:GNAT superfamily N-acetyltransferase
MTIAFKPINTGDAKMVGKLAALHHRVFGDGAPVPPLDGHWWIAYDGDKAIGFCGLSLNVNTAGAGFLCRAGVVSAYRGQGIQKKMIRLRERQALSLSLTQLLTYTIDNPSSANSLIACGYRTYSPKKKWAAPEAVYWQKVIE